MAGGRPVRSLAIDADRGQLNTVRDSTKSLYIDCNAIGGWREVMIFLRDHQEQSHQNAASGLRTRDLNLNLEHCGNEPVDQRNGLRRRRKHKWGSLPGG